MVPLPKTAVTRDVEDCYFSSALPLNLISTYAIYIIIAEEDAEEAEEEWRFLAKYIVITLTYSPPCSLL